MNTFTKIGYLSAIATILSISASFASGNPPKDELSTGEKVGREVARVKGQVKGAASDVKHGFKDNEKKMEEKYTHHDKHKK